MRGPVRVEPSRRDLDRAAGMVTAELAVALPALALVLLMCLGAVSLVAAQIRCADAAQAAARLASRGEPASIVAAVALATAPRGARVVLRSEPDGLVRVTVIAAARLPGLPVRLPLPDLRGSVTEQLESSSSR
jgi:hypothetical protein